MKKIRVENHFPVEIFEIFHFQSTLPNMVKMTVEKFLKNEIFMLLKDPTTLHPSIAVLIHEVPHGLADFAILVQSGLTIKEALCLNILSSLTSYAGKSVDLIP